MEDKYKKIIENSAFGLIEVDLNDRICNVKSAFCNICGYSEQELLGTYFSDLFVVGDKDQRLKKHSESILKENHKNHEAIIRKKDGSLVSVLYSQSAIYDSGNHYTGYAALFVDITPYKNLESKENTISQQSTLPAYISHEIRNPVQIIIGMADLMSRTKLNYDQVKYLRSIQSASSVLLFLVNDILDFSKIESGKLVLETMPVSISDLIEKAVEGMSIKASEKNVLINSRIDPLIHPQVWGDGFRLNQIILNLLSNAVKFTEKGEITVECVLRENKNSSQMVEFIVSDTGIGISPQHLDLIFEEFNQGDPSVTRKYGGTGLGLSITKRLVELMGGKIEVKSELGKGTCFSFMLAFRKCLEAPNSLPENPSKELHLKGVRILVAEDNSLNQLLINTILKSWQAEVDLVSSGVEAITKLKQSRYDLVLMDILMPELDGLHATQLIRNELHMSIPIIALTANVTEDDKEKYRIHGMNGFVLKPFNKQELFDQILTILKK